MYLIPIYLIITEFECCLGPIPTPIIISSLSNKQILQLLLLINIKHINRPHNPTRPNPRKPPNQPLRYNLTIHPIPIRIYPTISMINPLILPNKIHINIILKSQYTKFISFNHTITNTSTCSILPICMLTCVDLSQITVIIAVKYIDIVVIVCWLDFVLVGDVMAELEEFVLPFVVVAGICAD